jgi:hypothetical protein
MVTHFVPQWLLKRFGSPLYELDIFTGRVERRNVRGAASGDDLWPEQIEKDLMGTHDNDAAQVFRYSINGKRRIVLTSTERRTVALWLALFMARVPNTAEDFKLMSQDVANDPELVIQLMYKRQSETLQRLYEMAPEAYRYALETFGKYVGEAFLMAVAARKLRSHVARAVPDPTTTYHEHLVTHSLEKRAEMLGGYQWTWLYSPHGFIISDNPFNRWHELSQGWNSGIVRDNQITMPLSANLCLKIERRKWQDNGRLIHCPRAVAAEYNRRQRLAATSHVYSGDPELLQGHAAARPKGAKRPVPPRKPFTIRDVQFIKRAD